MPHPEILRQTGVFPATEQCGIFLQKSGQAAAEIMEEQFIVPAGKQLQNLIVILMQVVEKMLVHYGKQNLVINKSKMAMLGAMKKLLKLLLALKREKVN